MGHRDDEEYIALLEMCAAERRRLGLPSYTREHLELLFELVDAPVPEPVLPPNVVRFRPREGRRARRRRV
jgi:hypothetical protein